MREKLNLLQRSKNYIEVIMWILILALALLIGNICFVKINSNRSFIEDYPLVLISLVIILVLVVAMTYIVNVNQKRHRYIFYHDELTGLYNRQWEIEEINNKIFAEQPFAVLFLSLNEFKRVNDKLGREGGDLVLKHSVDRMKSFVNESKDLKLVRYGGDEFAIIIEANDDSYYEEVCKKTSNVLDEPFVYDDGVINLSYSICVVRYPHDAESYLALQQLADAGMRKVKRSEKNGYLICDEALLESVERERIILHKLNEALVSDGFKLLYQAKYKVSDNSLYGFEALLRMKDNYAYPGEFIRIAEENRLMIPIGRELTEIAVRQMADWKAKYKKLPYMSINFSTYQIYDDDYPEYLVEILKRYDVPPDKIIIEITESASLSERSETKEYMSRFTKHGIRLSIDDFGT
ncbi:MAG: EAL domain-containing protein, partial [Butyrivibrio sp.]|nr:EAL domain-containing protein [Butyrivibrio sp.]